VLGMGRMTQRVRPQPIGYGVNTAGRCWFNHSNATIEKSGVRRIYGRG
jgi:hypothetical protein